MDEHSEQPSTSGENRDIKWDRLKHALDYALQPVVPGQPAPEVPPQLREWAQLSCIASFAGILFQGSRQYIRNRRLGEYRPKQAGLSKVEEVRLITEENTRRLSRLLRQAVKGGLSFGALAGLFHGVQLLSTVANGERTIFDTVLASTVAGAASGLFMPGGASGKSRTILVGSALGACIGVPVGFLHMKIEENMGVDQVKAAQIVDTDRDSSKKQYPEHKADPTSAVIRNLEASLK